MSTLAAPFCTPVCASHRHGNRLDCDCGGEARMHAAMVRDRLARPRTLFNLGKAIL